MRWRRVCVCVCRRTSKTCVPRVVVVVSCFEAAVLSPRSLNVGSWYAQCASYQLC